MQICVDVPTVLRHRDPVEVAREQVECVAHPGSMHRMPVARDDELW